MLCFQMSDLTSIWTKNSQSIVFQQLLDGAVSSYKHPKDRADLVKMISQDHIFTYGKINTPSTIIILFKNPNE